MTTDDAAKLLATYELTGSVSETARQLGKAKSTVSEHLKNARIVVQRHPELATELKEKNWAAAWGQREQKGLEIVDERITKSDTATWDIMRWTGIAADKRFREEHPETAKGVYVDARHQTINVTENALIGLREAQRLLAAEAALPSEASQDAILGPSDQQHGV